MFVHRLLSLSAWAQGSKDDLLSMVNRWIDGSYVMLVYETTRLREGIGKWGYSNGIGAWFLFNFFLLEIMTHESSNGDLGKVSNKFMNFSIKGFKIDEGFDGSIVNCASNADCDNGRG